ncbi:hypothetical protein BH11PLA1_BH11PLA1_14640 [soil metagenome]
MKDFARMRNRRSAKALSVALLLLAGMATNGALAQPAEMPPPPPPMGEPEMPGDGNPPPGERADPAGGRGEREGRRRAVRDGRENTRENTREIGEGREVAAPLDPAEMKSTLEAVLTQTRALVVRLEGALKELEAGKPPAEIRRSFVEARENYPGPALFESLRKAGLLGLGMRREGGERAEAGEGAPATINGGAVPGGGPRGNGPGGRPAPTPEDRERILGEVRTHSPELSAQIEALRKTAPEAADSFVDALGDKLRGMREMKQRDPALYELRREELKNLFDVLRLRREYGDAARADPKSPHLAEIKGQLREHVAALVDIRQKTDENMLKQLEERTQKMRREIDARSADRAKAVDERTDAVIRDSMRGKPRQGPPGRRPE